MPTFTFLMKDINVHLKVFLRILGENNIYLAMAMIVTSIVIAMARSYAKRERRVKTEAHHPPVFTRSMSLGALHGGELAMERLIDYHQARAGAASHAAAEKELEEYLRGNGHPNFKRLQRTAAKLEMMGKEAIAVDILEKKLEKYRKEGKPHEAYEIEMLLVEMYIYKGDFKKALDCECLKHEDIYDARRPLYKAMIHIMLEHPRERALNFWQEYEAIKRNSPVRRHRKMDEAITNFTQFEKFVKFLKSDIRQTVKRS